METYANNECYRAIYTAGEDLLGDLGLDITQDEINFLIQTMNNSGIDHSGEQKNRCFDYAFDRLDSSWLIPNDSLLSPLLRGGESRFSDGSFGMFYAAEDEDTALLEVIYHDVARAREYFDHQPDVETWTTPKCIYICNIETRFAVDLTKRDDTNEIVNPVSYRYSRKVGKDLHDRRVQLIRYPSARNTDGICLAILSPLAIVGVSKWKYYRIVLVNHGGTIAHKVTRNDKKELIFKEGGEPEIQL